MFVVAFRERGQRGKASASSLASESTGPPGLCTATLIQYIAAPVEPLSQQPPPSETLPKAREHLGQCSLRFR